MKHVAILIDDGPHAANGPRLLEILKSNEVRANFAHIGNNVHEYPGVTRSLADAGHQILNHSMTHGRLGEMNDAELRDEILRPLPVFEQALGFRPRFYWPPYNAHDPRMYAVIREGGMQLFRSEDVQFVSSEDWNSEIPRSEIISRALSGVDDPSLEERGDRRVILFHEWRNDSLIAIQKVIGVLKGRGYSFVTLSELIGEE